MRNVKDEQGLGGDHNWPRLPVVFVAGDQSVGWPTVDADKTSDSLQGIVVLEVAPQGIGFLVGFKTAAAMQFLRQPIEPLDGRFGMRVNEGNVEFFVIPQSLDGSLRLRAVEYTYENDPKYAELPLY